MSRIIIGIHGLGNKPPREVLKLWWQKSIQEGLRHLGYHNIFIPFELVYWADVFHKQPLDIQEKNPESPFYLESPYVPSSDFIPPRIGKIRQRVLDFLEKEMKKFFSYTDYSNTLDLVSDWLIRRYFNDLNLYFRSAENIDEETQLSARQIIHQRLLTTLKKHQNKDILLIAHSMGSIIAYEVLSLYEKECQIDTLVTIGSPLGQPLIYSKYYKKLARKEFEGSQLSVPENIRNHWYNLADLRDFVAMNHQLSENFRENSRHLEIVDKIVTNDYYYQNKPNPHKVYGYLRTPEMAKIIYEFLSYERSKFGFWLSNRFQEFKQKYFDPAEKEAEAQR